MGAGGCWRITFEIMMINLVICLPTDISHLSGDSCYWQDEAGCLNITIVMQTEENGCEIGPELPTVMLILQSFSVT